MASGPAAASLAPGTDSARPVNAGNAQAKKCVEDFVTRLEAMIQKRLRVKGGTQTFDWTKLNAAVAAAPAYKSRPPILPSSRTWRTDLAVEMKPEIKQLLRDVFIRYCGWGDQQNFMFISRQQFIRFARDMGMCGAGVEEIDALGLSGLFDKILLGSLDPGAASRLAMSDFVLAVTGLGTRLCPSESVQASFEQVVYRYVVPHLSLPLPEPEPIDSALLHMDLVTTLEKHRTKIQVLWDAYVAQQQLPAGREGDSPTQSQSGEGKSDTISLNTFLRFCTDFDITVTLLSKIQLIQAFKRSRYGSAADVIDSNPHTHVRLSFSEWLDCLARCALLAFDYQPPPVVVPTLDFKGSYHTHAKQLWLREAGGAGALRGDGEESELEMPAAVNDAIGNEDRAHYDDVASRAPSAWRKPSGSGAFRDRLISRAISVAQGRTHTRDEDGAEMMLIHAEPSTIAQDPNKPLHLQHFSCDWVGQPGLTLSETGRLRQRSTDPWIAAGLYHTQVGVDPKYEQRSNDMQSARLVRDQHMEALNLHYQAARRDQIRDTTRQAAARRQDLELAAGQTLARVMGATGAGTTGRGSGGASPASAGRRGPRGQAGRAGGEEAEGRAGSAPPSARQSRRGSEAAGGSGGGAAVPGLEEVLSYTGGRVGTLGAKGGVAGGTAGRSKTLIDELQGLLDFESRLPQASIAGHGAIRFG